jgi:four helix bundle protein
MSTRGYNDLIVWQKGMDLVDALYDVTASFPENERFNLTSQMRRSAVSIPSNIAEGSKRRSNKEFRQFLHIAYGSGAELETQIKIAKRRHFGGDWAKVDSRLSEVMKMLHTMCINMGPKPINY